MFIPTSPLFCSRSKVILSPFDHAAEAVPRQPKKKKKKRKEKEKENVVVCGLGLGSFTLSLPLGIGKCRICEFVLLSILAQTCRTCAVVVQSCS